jgi:hypothetical protein
MMDFSELRDVELREAWPNEDTDFTPWLEDNLQRLSRAIGIAIEPDDSQVAVDGFSADILANFPVNGSRVVIENQLENTDHAHLGQIMINLARLEAQSAIWVAREFHPAHLAAIRWLNINTPGDFAFFAVRVRAVRIGEFPAPIAPVFEVIEKPHDWDRRVVVLNRTAQGAGGVNNRLNRLRRKRSDFWRAYAEQHPGDLQVGDDHAHSNVYVTLGGAMLSQYVGDRSVGIYLVEHSRSYDVDAARAVSMYKEGLQLNLGDSSESLAIDTNDRDNWPDMIDWLHGKLTEFRRVIDRYSTGAVDEVSEYEPAEFE